MRKVSMLIMAVLVLPLSVFASSNTGHHFGDNHKHMLKVALWGDMFYFDPAIKDAKIDQTIQSMNDHDVDFTIFAGDTKNGSSFCTDQAIGNDVITIFKLHQRKWQ